MATERQGRRAQEPIAFYRSMLKMLERGAIGDVEKVKSNLLKRIKLAKEQRTKRREQ